MIMSWSGALPLPVRLAFVLLLIFVKVSLRTGEPPEVVVFVLNEENVLLLLFVISLEVDEKVLFISIPS